jgi:ATP-dependent helicase/nuclease subunit A
VIPDIPSIKPDNETVREISDRLGYVYPYSSLGGVVAKRIASKFDAEEIGGEYFASRKPAFVGKDKLTPAQRGTATHRFMQYADYEKAGKSVSDELDRLVRDGMLTEAEASAVDQKPIAEFFSGSLAKRILSAEKVYREYTFAACIPLKEIQPDIPENEAENENVVIQGAVDCAFVENGSLVIVDFKTDRAKSDEELVEKYKDQLGIYCRCLSEVLDIPVKEAVIYSFRLGKSIEMCL